MTGAFEHHLREAIALNRERAPRYAELTAGRSRRVSLALIASEFVLLPVAKWFDQRAAPWEQAGVPLMASLFVPMAGAAAFAPHRPIVQGQGAPRPNVAAIRRRAVAAFADGSFAAAAVVLDEELARLDAHPATDCMVRHLLESARRIALFAPVHAEGARRAGLRDPLPLLRQLLRMHLWGLASGAMLDRWARPLQMEGIPILAQDLPPIPVPSVATLSGSTSREMHA